jgi:RimJ/RimL family protein N-acetyltransferase
MNNREFTPITTSRLYIEPINKVYMQEIFSEKNNPEVNQYLAQKSATSIEQLENWIDATIIRNNQKDIIQLQVSKKDTAEFVGMSVIRNPQTTEVELGLWLKQSVRGKGYGKELIWVLIGWIDENLDYESIIYETFADNIGSVKIIESLWGKYYSSEQKENYYGEEMTHNQYRITKKQ